MFFYAYTWPLCTVNTLWNIIMILHIYEEPVMTMCRIQVWQLSILHLLSYFPLVVSDAILCPLCNLNTLWYYIMTLYSYVAQVLTMCRVQELQLLLSYFLSYFPLVVSDVILCPLHNLNTLWYIIMTLYSYVEQVLTMCRVQEWQLSLSYFLSYFPLVLSDAILSPLCNLNTRWYIIMTLYSHVAQLLTMWNIREWQLLLAYFLSYFPLIVLAAMLSILNTEDYFHDTIGLCRRGRYNV